MDTSTVDKDKAWSDFINNTSSNSVVGLYNDKIVAYGSVVVENKVRGEVAGHIEDIVVDSEVRGKMIGVSLIKELIKVAKNKGCYMICKGLAFQDRFLIRRFLYIRLFLFFGLLLQLSQLLDALVQVPNM